jgi:hypothetical protein
MKIMRSHVLINFGTQLGRRSSIQDFFLVAAQVANICSRSCGVVPTVETVLLLAELSFTCTISETSRSASELHFINGHVAHPPQ